MIYLEVGHFYQQQKMKLALSYSRVEKGLGVGHLLHLGEGLLLRK